VQHTCSNTWFAKPNAEDSKMLKREDSIRAQFDPDLSRFAG
jgi:hypothetical protein